MAISVDESKIMSCVKGSPCGIASVFVKIDKKWAIKLYSYEDDRNSAYRNQAEAAEYGLGPDVGETIDFGINCKYPYGYITEIVEVLVPHEDIAISNYNELYRVRKTQEFKDKVRELHEELFNKTGINYCDMHPGNIGVKNGEYVLIDFGQEGIEGADYDCNDDDDSNDLRDSNNFVIANDSRLD